MADRRAIEAMFARCSFESRYARFLAPVAAFPADQLARGLSSAPGHEAWLATPRSGPETVVALGSWARVGTGAEVALLVEDSWQRRGIGTALLDVLVAEARDGGVCQLTAAVLSESRHVLRMLRRAATRTSTNAEGVLSEILMDVCA
ncbi:MAG: GNAT family N-acetyltransferase [Acidimicrobiia bacterium]